MTGHRGGVPGWILAEILLAMAILALLLSPLEDLAFAVTRLRGTVLHEIETVAVTASAQAAVLQLAREGYGPTAIAAALRPRFPDLVFRVDGPVCRVEVAEP